jgi:hypothetical protein
MMSEPSGSIANRELRLEECVHMDEICVPLTDCVRVVPGLVPDEVIDILTQRSLDQAPVCEMQTGICYGLVTTEYLRQLRCTCLPLKKDDPAIQVTEYRVGTHTTISDVIHRLRTYPVTLVIQESDTMGYGNGERLIGLLTVSDLNKQAIRNVLYRMISETEAAAATLVQRTFADPWKWIALLNEEHQVRVVGFWELAKRRDVDVGPIAAVTLTNLLTIIAKSAELRSVLGYSSKSGFEKQVGRIPDFRNRTMHPVRPLVLRGEDLEQILNATLFLRDLRDRSLNQNTGGLTKVRGVQAGNVIEENFIR